MIKKETPLQVVKKLGEPCERCGHCCQYSSGFLAGDDVRRISGYLGIGEDELKKRFLEKSEKFNTHRYRPKLIRDGKPYGRCIFYENGCKIHAVKPLQCRINNCSEHGQQLALWFMLNYFVNSKDPESIRQYDVYLRSGGKTLPGGEIDKLVPDKEKLAKILKFEIR